MYGFMRYSEESWLISIDLNFVWKRYQLRRKMVKTKIYFRFKPLIS